MRSKILAMLSLAWLVTLIAVLTIPPVHATQLLQPSIGKGQITMYIGPTDILSTGTKACSTVENSATLVAAHLIADVVPTGANLAVDVKAVAFTSYTGFASAASITGGNIPTITTAAGNPRYEDLTLTSWTKAVTGPTVFCAAITTAPLGGSSQASLTLKYTIP